jgi:hypothetical protein
MNGNQGGQQFGPGRGPGYGMMANNANAQDANTQDSNTQSTPAQVEFHPIYNVICSSNKVDYMVHVDAVSGTVLHCRAIASR